MTDVPTKGKSEFPTNKCLAKGRLPAWRFLAIVPVLKSTRGGFVYSGNHAFCSHSLLVFRWLDPRSSTSLVPNSERLAKPMIPYLNHHSRKGHVLSELDWGPPGLDLPGENQLPRSGDGSLEASHQASLFRIPTAKSKFLRTVNRAISIGAGGWREKYRARRIPDSQNRKNS